MKSYPRSVRRAVATLCILWQATNGLTAGEKLRSLVPLSHAVEADTEGVISSDIKLTDTRLAYRHQGEAIEWDAAFSYASFDLDYRPFTEFDFFGFPEHLHEDRFGGQGNLRYSPLDRLTLLGAAGVYTGYPDYRRVWIANRFRQ